MSAHSKQLQSPDTAFQSQRPQDRKLDVVIAHHSAHNLVDMVDLWTKVLEEPAVHHLSPYIFLYCQYENFTHLDLSWFSERGEVQPLRNLGREAHAYMWHIVTNYNDLASHTLFHQDLLQDITQNEFFRRLSMFMPYTGMLALSTTTMCTCDACLLGEVPKVREIWAMTQHTFCAPADLYPVFWKADFIVSSSRIRRNMPKTYWTLLQYLEAPEGHWHHAEHTHDVYRHPNNPLSAHIMERAWTFIFDCIHLDGPEECVTAVCESGRSDCILTSCQCFDKH